MEEAGIIQNGSEATAKHLNEIYPRMGKWWKKEIMGVLKGEIVW